MIKKYVILKKANEHPRFAGWHQCVYDVECESEQEILKKTVKSIIDPWLQRTLMSDTIFSDFGFSVNTMNIYTKSKSLQNFLQIGKVVSENKHNWSPQDFVIISTQKFFNNYGDNFSDLKLSEFKKRCDIIFESQDTFTTGGGIWSYTPLNGSRQVFSDNNFHYVAGHAHSIMQFTGHNVLEQALNRVHFIKSGIYKFPSDLHDLMVKHLDLINEDIIND